MSELLDVIKQAAVEAWEAEQPVQLRFGKVESVDPLAIKISDSITLTKEFVIMTGTVAVGDMVSVIRKQGGQQYLVLGNRTQHITGTVITNVGGNEYVEDAGSLSTKRNALLSLVKSKIGCPYVWGATGSMKFDCSGLMLWCYKQIGMSIPRTAAAQYAASKRISKAELKVGDLVFFSGTTGRSGITHVGMYVGGGYMIHAANPRTGVVRVALSNSYYANHYAGAGRFLND